MRKQIKKSYDGGSVGIIGLIFLTCGMITGIIAIFLYPLVFISIMFWIFGISFEVRALILSANKEIL